jgi:hypothetical protein
LRVRARLSSGRLVKFSQTWNRLIRPKAGKEKSSPAFSFWPFETSLLRKRNALARQPLVACASEPNPFWHTIPGERCYGEKPASAASDVLEALTSRSP